MSSLSMSIQQLRSSLTDATSKTSALEVKMNTTARDSRDSILTALELAVGAKLFKVALYIHGNYDNSQHDASTTKSIVGQMNEAFERVSALADDSHKAMEKIHVEINELKSGVVRPLKDKLRESSQILNDAIDQARRDQRTLQGQSEENARTIQRIESNVKEYELIETPLADIGMGVAEGLGWLGGNIAKLWGDDGYDKSMKPLELLREARTQLSNERVRAAGLVRQILEAQVRCLNLEADLQVNTQMQNQMPELVEAGDNLYDKSGAILKLMVLLKTEAVNLSRKAADASVYASIDVVGARKKSNFTAGILEICESALVDPRLTDEVKMVLDELVAGYEGESLGTNLEEMVNTVSAKLKTLEA